MQQWRKTSRRREKVKNAIIVNCLSVVTLTPMPMTMPLRMMKTREDDITYVTIFALFGNCQSMTTLCFGPACLSWCHASHRCNTNECFILLHFSLYVCFQMQFTAAKYCPFVRQCPFLVSSATQFQCSLLQLNDKPFRSEHYNICKCTSIFEWDAFVRSIKSSSARSVHWVMCNLKLVS